LGELERLFDQFTMAEASQAARITSEPSISTVATYRP
jgi:hypothetical protein